MFASNSGFHPSSATNNDPTLAEMMAACRSEAYMAAFEENGWDDPVFLFTLGKRELENVLSECGMKPGHANKFLCLFELFKAERQTQQSTLFAHTGPYNTSAAAALPQPPASCSPSAVSTAATKAPPAGSGRGRGHGRGRGAARARGGGKVSMAELYRRADEASAPTMGELLEVEVADLDGPAVSWKPAKVIERLGAGRFRVMVHADEAFVEEFGMEDLDKEWRRVPESAMSSVHAAYKAARGWAVQQQQQQIRVPPALATGHLPPLLPATARGTKRKADAISSAISPAALVPLPSSAVTLIHPKLTGKLTGLDSMSVVASTSAAAAAAQLKAHAKAAAKAAAKAEALAARREAAAMAAAERAAKREAAQRAAAAERAKLALEEDWARAARLNAHGRIVLQRSPTAVNVNAHGRIVLQGSPTAVNVNAHGRIVLQRSADGDVADGDVAHGRIVLQRSAGGDVAHGDVAHGDVAHGDVADVLGAVQVAADEDQSAGNDLRTVGAIVWLTRDAGVSATYGRDDWAPADFRVCVHARTSTAFDARPVPPGTQWLHQAPLSHIDRLQLTKRELRKHDFLRRDLVRQQARETIVAPRTAPRPAGAAGGAAAGSRALVVHRGGARVTAEDLPEDLRDSVEAVAVWSAAAEMKRHKYTAQDRWVHGWRIRVVLRSNAAGGSGDIYIRSPDMKPETLQNKHDTVCIRSFVHLAAKLRARKADAALADGHVRATVICAPGGMVKLKLDVMGPAAADSLAAADAPWLQRGKQRRLQPRPARPLALPAPPSTQPTTSTGTGNDGSGAAGASRGAPAEAECDEMEVEEVEDVDSEEVEEVEVGVEVQDQVGDVDEGANPAIHVEEALPLPPSTSAGVASSSPMEESMEGPIGVTRFDLNPSDEE